MPLTIIGAILWMALGVCVMALVFASSGFLIAVYHASKGCL